MPTEEYSATELEELLGCFDDLLVWSVISGEGTFDPKTYDAIERALKWAERNNHPLLPHPDTGCALSCPERE